MKGIFLILFGIVNLIRGTRQNLVASDSSGTLNTKWLKKRDENQIHTSQRESKITTRQNFSIKNLKHCFSLSCLVRILNNSRNAIFHFRRMLIIRNEVKSLV